MGINLKKNLDSSKSKTDGQKSVESIADKNSLESNTNAEFESNNKLSKDELYSTMGNDNDDFYDLKKIIPSLLLFVALVIFSVAIWKYKGYLSEQRNTENQKSESTVVIGSEKISIPKHIGFVNDFSGVLSKETIDKFEDTLTKLQKAGKIDLAIVLIDTTNNIKIDNYSLAIAKDWKVGSENGGLLLVMAIEDRKWHIQINKELEKKYSNEKIAELGQVIVEDYRKKDYKTGLEKFINQTIKLFEKDYDFKLN